MRSLVSCIRLIGYSCLAMGVTVLAGCQPQFFSAQPPATATAVQVPGSPVATAVGSATAPSATGTATKTSNPSPAPSASATPDATVRPQAGKTPDDLLFVVSKSKEIPQSYVPGDLTPVDTIVRSAIGRQRVRQVVTSSLQRMVEAMRGRGLNPAVSSGYRSYSEQAATFDYWTKTLGLAKAERVSARPGHSEHQLGTAIDFSSAENGYQLDETFAKTREGIWLLEHAREFGFALSYPANKESVTGYAYEPWHFRFVGEAVARLLGEKGLTLAELVLQ